MGETFGVSILPGVRSLEEKRQVPRLRYRYAFMWKDILVDVLVQFVICALGIFTCWLLWFR